MILSIPLDKFIIYIVLTEKSNSNRLKAIKLDCLLNGPHSDASKIDRRIN